MAEITDYLREKIVEVRFGRLVGEVAWALGTPISVLGLYLSSLLLVFTGFGLMFAGLFLSVHYELRMLDYKDALKNLEQHER